MATENITNYSNTVVTTAITKIPPIKATICLSDSFGSSSLSKSGRTVTSAMWRKVPAVKGRIHDVLASAINKSVKTFFPLADFNTYRVSSSTTHNGREGANQAPSSCQNLKNGGIPPTEPRFEQNGEVADFVWNFVHQNRESSQKTQPKRHQEGAP